MSNALRLIVFGDDKVVLRQAAYRMALAIKHEHVSNHESSFHANDVIDFLAFLLVPDQEGRQKASRTRSPRGGR